MTNPENLVTRLLNDVHELLSVRTRPEDVEEWRELLWRAKAKLHEVERYQREMQCANYRIVMEHLSTQTVAIGELREAVRRIEEKSDHPAFSATFLNPILTPELVSDYLEDSQVEVPPYTQGCVNLPTEAAEGADPIEHMNGIPSSVSDDFRFARDEAGNVVLRGRWRS